MGNNNYPSKSQYTTFRVMAKSVLNPRRYPRAALRTRPADGMLIPSERKEKGTLPPSYVKRTLTNLEPSSGDRVSL
jgi:hypothetical protein